MIELIIFILGAIYRRCKGGAFAINSTVIRIMGFLLPLVVGWYVWGIEWITLIYAGLMLFAWLMPKHGYGIGMGYDKPLWACVLVMGLQYGAVTGAVGAIWYLGYGSMAGLFYAPVGFSVPLAYYLAKVLGAKRINGFIDGYTAYGEMWLGGALLGGAPLCSALTKLV